MNRPAASRLFAGPVTHERLRPRRHRLRYRVFWTLLDLDELPALSGRLRLFSHNRAGLFSFHDRDHGDGSNTPLRAQVASHLRAAGIETGGGPVRIFCMPRVLGYVFNPISLYFCHRPDETLAAILYEVNNTFGQRHTYLLPVTDIENGMVRQGCAKLLYVSPFMEMAMRYEFRVRLSGNAIAVAIDGIDADGVIIRTALSGARRTLTDANLLRILLGFPLLTLKVIAAIHWEALRLWLKGVKMTKRPPGPERPVSVGISADP
jgi:DUF1365 family protein